MIEIRITTGGNGMARHKVLLYAAGLIALLFAWYVRAVWPPVFAALLIAVILDPLVDRMEKRGWKRFNSTALIFLAFFLSIGIVVTLVVPAVVTQTSELVSTVAQYLPTDGKSKQLSNILDKHHPNPFVRSAVLHAANQTTAALNSATSRIGSLAQSAAVDSLYLVIVLIIAFYTLKDFHLMYARAMLLVPISRRAWVQDMLNHVSDIFGRYLRGLTVVCALNGVATAVVLALFQIPNSIALGAISAVLYVVPYFGAFTTILLVSVVSLMRHGMGKPIDADVIQMTLIVAGTLVFLHSIIFDQVITPRIVGKHVGLHPVLSIVALLIGGEAMGIAGMILAVPFAAVVQLVAEQLLPALTRPIDIPAGVDMKDRIDQTQAESTSTSTPTDAEQVHQTIMEAVDAVDMSEDAPSSDAPPAEKPDAPPAEKPPAERPAPATHPTA